MTQPLKILFMGTPEFALVSLKKLCESEGNVCALVCQPDKPKGRGQKLMPCPSKKWAEENKIVVMQPDRCKDCGFVEEVKKIAPDLIVVASFGQILPRDLLEVPKFGSINVHSSLLPKYRGASPITYAILNGDQETGVTVMQIVEKLDAGPILLQRALPIEPDDTAGTLHDKIAKLGAELLKEAIDLIKAGKIKPVPQDDSQAVYAPMLKKEQGRIDWKEPAEIIGRKIRAFNPWPGAFLGEGVNLIKIWKASPSSGKGAPGEILEAHNKWIEVACGIGSLRILELQPASKKIMSPEAFLAGRKIQVGEKFQGKN
jgi:methionyl-tRNA formyltransferase